MWRMVRGAIAWLLYFIGRAVPRDPRLWVYGTAKNAFADNSKFQYLWASRHSSLGCRHVWVTADKTLVAQLKSAGLLAEHRWSMSGLWLTLRAGAFVFSYYSTDINFLTGARAVQVNLWHGVGIKNIEFATRSGPLAGRDDWLAALDRPERFRRPDLFLAPSGLMAEHFARAFRLDGTRMLRAGYPRNLRFHDSSFDREVERFESAELPPLGTGRMILYMPTWRDVGGDFWAAAMPDMHALTAALEAAEARLWIKPHPNSPVPARLGGDRVQVIPSRVDIQRALAVADALITDYSSVLYDYLSFRDVGAVVYCFDLARYVSESRDLAYDFRDNIAGAIATSFEELLGAIRSGTAFAPVDDQDLRKLRNRFLDADQDRTSCADIDRAIAQAAFAR